MSDKLVCEFCRPLRCQASGCECPCHETMSDERMTVDGVANVIYTACESYEQPFATEFIKEALVNFSSQQSAGLVEALKDCEAQFGAFYSEGYQHCECDKDDSGQRCDPVCAYCLSTGGLDITRKALAAYYLTHPKNPTKEGVNE